MPGWRLPLVGALALTMGLAPVGAAMAAPPAMPPTVAEAGAGSAVTEVGHWHDDYDDHDGGDFAIGLGIGIIGGLIASEAARSRGGYYDYDDAREACARRFRSFEWNTGLYTTYGGDKRLCPYLR